MQAESHYHKVSHIILLNCFSVKKTYIKSEIRDLGWDKTGEFWIIPEQAFLLMIKQDSAVGHIVAVTSAWFLAHWDSCWALIVRLDLPAVSTSINRWSVVCASGAASRALQLSSWQVSDDIVFVLCASSEALWPTKNLKAFVDWLLSSYTSMSCFGLHKYSAVRSLEGLELNRVECGDKPLLISTNFPKSTTFGHSETLFPVFGSGSVCHNLLITRSTVYLVQY